MMVNVSATKWNATCPMVALPSVPLNAQMGPAPRQVRLVLLPPYVPVEQLFASMVLVDLNAHLTWLTLAALAM